MNQVKYQLAVIAIASRKRKRPEELSDSERLAAAISARSVSEVVVDGVFAIKSAARTFIGIVVPVFVRNKREEICNACPHSERSKEGRLVCAKCGCSGGLMEARLQDPEMSCSLPVGQKKWQKYQSMTVNGLPTNADQS